MHASLQSQLADRYFRLRLSRLVRTVEEADGFRVIGERLHPHFQRTLDPHTLALDAARVLIDGDDRAIRQQDGGRWRHGSEIVARKEWCREQSPKTHVRPVFLLVHAAIADLEHVGIVPMSRAGITRDIDLTKAYGRHAEVAVGNVLSRTPEVAAHRGAPLPD